MLNKVLERELVTVINGVKLVSKFKKNLEGKLVKEIDSEKVEGLFNGLVAISDLTEEEQAKLLTVVYKFTDDEKFNPKQLIKVEEDEEEKPSKDKMPELYVNYDFKLAFADEYPAETKRVILALFRKTALIEKKHNTELYEMGVEELREVFKALKAKTVRSLQNTISTVERYIDFAIEHGKVKVNYATVFDTKDKLEKLLDKDAEENMIFDKDEIMEMAMNSDNAQDGVILGLLFDGVSHKNEFEELIELTINDIDFEQQEIKFTDRTVPMSTETAILVRKAYEEEIYVSVKGESSRKYKIAEGLNILRGLRGKAKVKSQIINQRILRIKEIFDYPYLNATQVAYSGQINFAKELMEDGMTLDEVVPVVMERFSIPSNESSRFYVKTRIEKYLDKIK